MDKLKSSSLRPDAILQRIFDMKLTYFSQKHVTYLVLQSVSRDWKRASVTVFFLKGLNNFKKKRWATLANNRA